MKPKAKNLEEFESWFAGGCGIDLVWSISKVGFNQYRFNAEISYCDYIEKYDITAKIWKINWKLKILDYTSKKIY